MTKLKLIASGLRFPEGPIVLEDGSVLVVEIERGTLTRVGRDGSLSVVAELGGGPNGAAVGPDGCIYVCNNGGFKWVEEAGTLRPAGAAENYTGGRIERVDPSTGRMDRLYESVNGRGLKGPNDIVFDQHGGFWFTDPGKARPRELDRGAVYYAKADGSAIREVAHPIQHPNGIALSPNGDRLYVAETHNGRVWSFEVVAPGELKLEKWPSPNGGKLLCGLPGYQLFDSMAVDGAGNVCVATLFQPAITVISSRGEVIEQHEMPDPYTTNICFGGPDLRTAYITLSHRGQLVAMDWPRPGLRKV